MWAGPATDVKAFLKELEAEDIFNRALDTNGVPYHSAVLQPLLPELSKCKSLSCVLCIASHSRVLKNMHDLVTFI